MNDKSRLSAIDVAFALAPRLNAAGRLGCARLVVELLTTTSSARATELARHLEVRNSERQQIERRILHEAGEAIKGLDLDSAPALVLASPRLARGSDRHCRRQAGRALFPAGASDRDSGVRRTRPGVRSFGARLSPARGAQGVRRRPLEPRRSCRSGWIQDSRVTGRHVPRPVLRVCLKKHAQRQLRLSSRNRFRGTAERAYARAGGGSGPARTLWRRQSAPASPCGAGHGCRAAATRGQRRAPPAVSGSAA